MRNVYQAPIVPQAALIRDMLAEAGIRARIMDGQQLPLHGATSPCQVWVSDADGDRALELIRRFRKESRDGSERKSWTCRGCREDNPGEFDVCWSCATERTW